MYTESFGKDRAARIFVAVYALLMACLIAVSIRERWLSFCAGAISIPQLLTTFLAFVNWMLISVCVAFRRNPISKYTHVLPKIEAFVGANLYLVLIFLGKNTVALPFDTYLFILPLVGNLIFIAALLQLNRSFSILPEARRFVCKGIYSVVRHPIYLGELLSLAGILLLFRSVEATIAGVFIFLFQCQRIVLEEAILENTFPEYKEYKKKTWYLVPYIV